MKLKASAATYSYSVSHSKEESKHLPGNLSIKPIVSLLIFLAALTLISYWPSLKYQFVFDDINVIKKFYNIRHWGLRQLFFQHSRWISFWLSTLCYKLGDFNPFPYRLINLIFHGATGISLTVLLYLMLSNITLDSYFKKYAKEIALLFGALFLLHPTQTQTVTYVVQGQLEGLAALFTSLILFCYFYAQKSEGVKKKFLIALTFLLTIISTGTKEITIVIPILVALIDWFFIAEGNTKKFLKRAPVILALALTTFVFYLYFLKPSFLFKALGLKLTAQNNIGNMLTNSWGKTITPFHFFISQFKVTLHYLLIYLWPFGIAADYDWKLVESPFSLDCIVPFAILSIVGAIVGYRLQKNKIDLIAFGLIWFLLCNAPRSTIIASSELVADYKAYLPAIGWLFLIASFTIYTAKNFVENSLLPYFICLISLVLAFGTYSRNLVWSTPINFWQDIVNKGPNKARSLNNLGTELNHKERWKEAIPLFEKAIQLEPHYWDAYNNLAGAYAVVGRLDEAIEVGEKGLKLNPHNSEAYSNLGSFYLFKGDLDNAEQLLKKALEISKNYGKAHYNLARLNLERNDLENAWLHYKKACREADLDNDLLAIMPYAGLSIELSKWDDAIWAIHKILKIAPNNPDIMEHHFNLGNCYAQKGDYNRAITTFRKHLKLYPSDYRATCNLIELYIIMGKLDSAESTLNNVIHSGGYPGIEVHKAKLLIAKGYRKEAKEILLQFINRPNIDSATLSIANQMLYDLI